MLSSYLRKRVSVVTVDGRNLVGVLHAADQLLNIVLTSCVERVGAPYDHAEARDSGDDDAAVADVGGSGVDHTAAPLPVMEEVHLGVLMLRGADVVTIAAVDVYEEAGTNVKDWRGRDMPPVPSAAANA
ncbi:LSM domain containing protein [Novymonas esmeraldas]|uniref:LSM domain containing protein n=1 Tax=Novymonas esmeraldas TaxID=1808958 RepID=A0AAW0ELM4_9TRYP